MLIKKMITISSLLAASTVISNAAVVNITPTGNTNEYEVNFDSFVLTTQVAGNLDWLIFEDFFTSNATADGTGSGTIDLTIEGVTTSFGFNNTSGTFDSTLGGIDRNDLFLNIAAAGPNNVAAGTEVTVSISASGNPTFISTNVPSEFNPTTDVSFYESNGPQVTNAVTLSTVPEPSSVLLSFIGLSALALRRRR